MKKQIVKIVSGLVLFVFFLGVAPKEYIHDVLFHHHDTVHPLYKKGETVFTGKHIHCSFLGFSFASFINSERQFISFRAIITHATCYVLPEYNYHYSSTHIVTALRGPPSIA